MYYPHTTDQAVAAKCTMLEQLAVALPQRDTDQALRAAGQEFATPNPKP